MTTTRQARTYHYLRRPSESIGATLCQWDGGEALMLDRQPYRPTRKDEEAGTERLLRIVIED